MWRTLLNKSVKELRFVLKQTPDHYGAWSFVKKSLPEIRQLNQNTFFSVTELNDGFETPSAMHVIYGDVDNKTEMIETSGLSSREMEEIIKARVEYGMTLKRGANRSLPVDVVQAGKTVQYMDDNF